MSNGCAALQKTKCQMWCELYDFVGFPLELHVIEVAPCARATKSRRPKANKSLCQIFLFI